MSEVVVLTNPIAVFQARKIFEKNKEYYCKKFNQNFIDSMREEIKFNLPNLTNVKFIKIGDGGLIKALQELRNIGNYEIKLDLIRILPEVLIVFEEEDINPLVVDGEGSFILVIDESKLESLDEDSIIYDVIGQESEIFTILRQGIEFDLNCLGDVNEYSSFRA